MVTTCRTPKPRKRKSLTPIMEDESIVEDAYKPFGLGSDSSLACTDDSLNKYSSLLNCGSLPSLPMTPMSPMGSRISIAKSTCTLAQSYSSLNQVTINQNLVMKVVKIQLVGYPAKRKAVSNGDLPTCPNGTTTTKGHKKSLSWVDKFKIKK